MLGEVCVVYFNKFKGDGEGI